MQNKSLHLFKFALKVAQGSNSWFPHNGNNQLYNYIYYLYISYRNIVAYAAIDDDDDDIAANVNVAKVCDETESVER